MLTTETLSSCLSGETKSRSLDCDREIMSGDELALPILPHELVVEIFSWLPAKHLWSLRFVSKTWFTLLTTNTQFTQLHLDRSLQNNKGKGPGILARRRTSHPSNIYIATEYIACDEAIHLEIPFDQGSIFYFVWGVCNGLVCLVSSVRKHVYIWNPLINDHIAVPYSPVPSRFLLGSRRDVFAFCFCPCSNSNEYKLVRLHNASSKQLDSRLHIRVYTLGIGSSWRTVEKDAPSEFGLVRGHTLLVNGVLYWIATRPTTPNLCIIVGFCLKDEVLRRILPPSDLKFGDSAPNQNKIMELGGSLCLFTQCNVDEPVQIWMMKKHGLLNSWTKQFTIRSPEIYQSFSYVKPLAAHDGEIILMMQREDFILYNPETNSTRKLKGFEFPILDAFSCAQSIVSPRVINGLPQIMK